MGTITGARGAACCAGLLTVLTAADFLVPAVAQRDGAWLVLSRVRLAPVVSVAAAAQVARFGRPRQFLVLASGAVALAASTAGARGAVRAGAVIGGATATTQLLQEALRRPRAFGLDLDPISEYPSGHLTGVSAIAITCTLLARPRSRQLAASAGVAATTLMGGALLSTNTHMPSDLAAGALVSAGWGFAAGAPLLRSAGRDRRTGRWIGAGVGLGLLALGGGEAVRVVGASVAGAPRRSAAAAVAIAACSTAAASALRVACGRLARR